MFSSTESPQRVEILGEDAERTSVGTVEKRLVVVRERLFVGHLQKLFHRLGGKRNTGDHEGNGFNTKIERTVTNETVAPRQARVASGEGRELEALGTLTCFEFAPLTRCHSPAVPAGDATSNCLDDTPVSLRVVSVRFVSSC